MQSNGSSIVLTLILIMFIYHSLECLLVLIEWLIDLFDEWHIMIQWPAKLYSHALHIELGNIPFRALLYLIIELVAVSAMESTIYQVKLCYALAAISIGA